MANLPPAVPNRIGPQPGPQEHFLSTPADIAIYGGAAGGGKTYALLLEALRHVRNPLFGAVLFRRTKEDIRNEGALWDNSGDLYGQLGAKAREQYLDWTFASGATISFDGLQLEKDVYNWQGAQICLLGFDELTHFTAKQFFYMMGRNRSICGVRPYIRATCNPDEDSWVFDLLGPWVNEEHPHYGAESGELRWFLRHEGEIVWVPEGTPKAKSITFIPALLEDNKILEEKDPGYRANLEAQDPDERDRLLLGLWTKRKVKGALWEQKQIDKDRVKPSEVPELERTVVAVDPGISSDPKSSPDETGIVGAGKSKSGHFYTLADSSGHYTPEGWAQEAIRLFYLYDASCIVAEKNQGGEMVRHTIHSVDPSVPVRLIHARDKKEVRAAPVATMAKRGKDHHVGTFPKLEGQLTRWVPGSGRSPDRMDAKVYAILDLDLDIGPETREEFARGDQPDTFSYGQDATGRTPYDHDDDDPLAAYR